MPDNIGHVTVTIEQKDTDLTYEQLGLHLNEDGQVVENDNQILDAVRAIVGEQIRDQNQNYTFSVRRAKNEDTGVWMTYVWPKMGYGEDETLGEVEYHPNKVAGIGSQVRFQPDGEKGKGTLGVIKSIKASGITISVPVLDGSPHKKSVDHLVRPDQVIRFYKEEI